MRGRRTIVRCPNCEEHDLVFNYKTGYWECSGCRYREKR